MVKENHRYFIYILESLKNSNYYIGCTTSLARRLEYHNKGLSLKEARARETCLKRWKNRDRLESLINKKGTQISYNITRHPDTLCRN